MDSRVHTSGGILPPVQRFTDCEYIRGILQSMSVVRPILRIFNVGIVLRAPGEKTVLVFHQDSHNSEDVTKYMYSLFRTLMVCPRSHMSRALFKKHIIDPRLVHSLGQAIDGKTLC